jgi:hypothetical protein
LLTFAFSSEGFIIGKVQNLYGGYKKTKENAGAVLVLSSFLRGKEIFGGKICQNAVQQSVQPTWFPGFDCWPIQKNGIFTFVGCHAVLLYA